MEVDPSLLRVIMLVQVHQDSILLPMPVLQMRNRSLVIGDLVVLLSVLDNKLRKVTELEEKRCSRLLVSIRDLYKSTRIE